MPRIFLRQPFPQNQDPIVMDVPLIMDTATAPLMKGTQPMTKIVIPPLNSINDLTAATAITKLGLEELTQAYENLPTPPISFTWQDHLPTLTRPPNQGVCGCCWAVAIASAINDVFQVSALISQNPKLTATYLLACDTVFNQQCNGGNPYLALEWIAKNGLGVSGFDWCLDNRQCNGTNKEQPVSGDILNSLIPSCNKVKQTSNLIFRIGNVQTCILKEEEAQDLQRYERYSNSIKKHILQFGPVVGGFIVFSNLFSGYFYSNYNPDGIYLENVDYQTHTYKFQVCSQQCIRNQFDLANCGQDKECLQCQQCNQNNAFRIPMGGHAVTIVGWGESPVKGSLLGSGYDQESFYKVPYWLIRNSWGEQWGNKGYYRHARYPFNKVSQFDIPVIVDYPRIDSDGTTVIEQVPSGGIVMFEPITFENIKETFQYSLSPKDKVNFFVLFTVILTFVVFILIILFFRK